MREIDLLGEANSFNVLVRQCLASRLDATVDNWIGSRLALLIGLALVAFAAMNVSFSTLDQDWRKRPHPVPPELWARYVSAVEGLGRCVESHGWEFPRPTAYPDDERFLIFGVGGAANAEGHAQAKADLETCRQAGFDATFDAYYDALGELSGTGPP